MLIHIVKQGETLFSIAQYYGISEESLIYDNQLEVQEYLVVGQALLIIYEEEIEERGQIQSGGYVYPFVNREILYQTLPYLTSISLFSYGFTVNGDLLPIQDTELIEAAWNMGTEPILVLTPFTAQGTFSNELVHVLVTDQNVQNNLIAQLLATTQEKGYAGVNVDFEYILREDRDLYTEFVRSLTIQMNQVNRFVSVSLAPKISATQPGLLYEGIDYGALGNVANSVFLMTYEWGYTFGPPMAVAPINRVREVLDYAVTEITPDKIDMGIPNYGYDWPLPYVRGETEAQSIGNAEAIQIAIANNAQIQYDETAQAPYFNYQRDGVEHIVWFEDVRSLQAKYRLVTEYGFRGVGYWQLMRYFRPNLILLEYLFDIEKFS